MEEGQGRARGRSRAGRARGVPGSGDVRGQHARGATPQQQAWPQPGGGQQKGPQTQGPPQQSAWPQPGAQQQRSQQQGGPQPQQKAWGPPPQQQQQQAQQQKLAPTARGRGITQQSQPQPKAQEPEGAYGIDPAVEQVGGAFRGLQIAEGRQPTQVMRRGAMRGRMEMVPPVVIKPQDLVKNGTYGAKIMIESNHFKLMRTTDWSLYQYRVDFSPEEDRTQVKKGLLRNHKEVLGDAYMFDGTMLFTIRRLPSDNLEVFSQRESDQQNIRITIKFTNHLAVGDYQYIQLFNIILRNCMDSLEFQLVNREYFDPHLKCQVQNFKLEIWPGFVTSILQYESDIMMNIDVSHKVLRQDTVHDVFQECKQRYRDKWQEKFSEAILGATVFTHYNNKPYLVSDVDFDSNPRSTFPKGDQNVSYLQYYQQRYNITIKDHFQPLLVSRPKARDIRGGRNQNIILIPELCNMTGMSEEMRSNFKLMKAVSDLTRVEPAKRTESYLKFMQRLQNSEAARKKLQAWNLAFDTKLRSFPGRILPPEIMLAGQGKEFSYSPPGADGTLGGDWNRTFTRCSMLLSIQLVDWVLILPAYYGRGGQGAVDNFLAMLSKAANSYRFNLPNPQKIVVESDRPASYYTAIEKAMSRQTLQLVMCIVPKSRADIYSSIKKKCCIDRPVASQVVEDKTMNHKNIGSIAAKIVIQINCKLGGAPWYIPLPFKVDNKEDPSMVVGFDVCHDGSARGRSFGAMVASLDYYFTKFYSAVSQHSFGEELSNDIATHITHALVRFRKLNDRLPTRIFIYRDGVGESNIPFVLDHEVNLIKTRIKELFPQSEFKMAFIVVSKRINTRIFVNRKNPPPGTIVDDVITRPEWYDFFLVSQSVRQGTVTPTHYNVIYDNTGLKPDLMQRVTYKMTHMYYNCSVAVRVPAQVQYAHKLAFLVGQSLHQSPSPALDQHLYFL